MKQSAAARLLRPWPPARPDGPSGLAMRRTGHLWQTAFPVEPERPLLCDLCRIRPAVHEDASRPAMLCGRCARW